MKKMISMLVLLTGITGNLCAQHKANEDRIFDIPDNSTNRRFNIDLGKGNKMRIELSDMSDLDRFKNMDSVIYGLLQDLKLLKDSLGDETYSRRIDYVMDDIEKRKIRIQKTKQKGPGFIVTDNEVSNLKTEQDTINFLGKVVYDAKYTMRKKFTTTRYYKISFFVNDLADLASYMNGTVNAKIDTLQRDVNKKWNNNGNSREYHLEDKTWVTAGAPKGYNAGGDFLTLRASADFQNYKSYFLPSFTFGANVVLTSKNFKREIGVSTEMHFSFRKNSEGQLKTFRDQFLVLSLAHGPIRDNDPQKESFQLFNLSFGYLIRNKGSIYEKNTMKLSVGTMSLFEGKTKIQPTMYFNNLFKGVTPGIRLVQSF